MGGWKLETGKSKTENRKPKAEIRNSESGIWNLDSALEGRGSGKIELIQKAWNDAGMLQKTKDRAWKNLERRRNFVENKGSGLESRNPADSKGG
ncbi:MAG: hypothetical protein ACE145_02040 [Terriglobia bacterium]